MWYRLALTVVLPDFQVNLLITADQLEIGAIGSDEPRAIRTRGERDQHVKMEVAQLFWRESGAGSYLSEKLA